MQRRGGGCGGKGKDCSCPCPKYGSSWRAPWSQVETRTRTPILAPRTTPLKRMRLRRESPASRPTILPGHHPGRISRVDGFRAPASRAAMQELRVKRTVEDETCSWRSACPCDQEMMLWKAQCLKHADVVACETAIQEMEQARREGWADQTDAQLKAGAWRGRIRRWQFQ